MSGEAIKKEQTIIDCAHCRKLHTLEYLGCEFRFSKTECVHCHKWHLAENYYVYAGNHKNMVKSIVYAIREKQTYWDGVCPGRGQYKHIAFVGTFTEDFNNQVMEFFPNHQLSHPDQLQHINAISPKIL